MVDRHVRAAQSKKEITPEEARNISRRAELILKEAVEDFYGEARVVDVHLGHIRQKLGEGHEIRTVRGIGYRFEGEPP